jgi:hypothetical protein
MQPNTRERTLESNGVSAQGNFGISLKDSAHIMTILRDTLYSDKILAVEREYAANAWDANRSVGKGDVPIKVTLPTEMVPVFVVRDSGPGLSHEDVFQVFTQYGASTKRDNNNEVGMLGIGCKSGFAYSDSFTVTSWHGGTKRIYTAVLDETEKGLMSLLHEEPCGDETGVEVQIAVKPTDINEFVSTAKKLFKYFQPQPECNVEMPKPGEKRKELKNGYLFLNNDSRYDDQGWTAVMGCIPYRISTDKLRGIGDRKIAEHLSQVSGVMFFDIGEVSVNASREELKYTDDTKTAIVAKLDNLIDEFVQNIVQEIEAKDMKPWDKKLAAQMLRKLYLPVPDHLKELVSGDIKFKDVPASMFFTGAKAKGIAEHLLVREDTRLILKDDRRRIQGWRLDDYDLLVGKNGDLPWAKVEADLVAWVEKMGLTGITITKLSELPWENPDGKRDSSGKVVNAKHMQRVFVYDPLAKSPSRTRAGLSWRWKTVLEHEPKEHDVYVVVKQFAPDPQFRLHEMYTEVKRFMDIFAGGTEMPTIIGYKTTDTKPIDREKIIGIEFREWARQFMQTLVTDQTKKFVEYLRWSKLSVHGVYQLDHAEHMALSASKKLGSSHPITNFFKKLHDKRWRWSLLLPSVQQAVDNLYSKMGPEFPREFDGELMIEDLTTRYPLVFAHNEGLGQLFRAPYGDDWIQYVSFMDKERPLP